MSDRFLSKEEFLEKLPQIGEGSEFRYETVMLPMGPDDLKEMMSEALRSYDTVKSRISKLIGNDTSLNTFERIRCKFRTMGYSGKLLEIVSLESDLLDTLRTNIDNGVDEPYNYIFASALKTISGINSDMSSVLDSISDGRVRNGSDSTAMVECDRELRDQKSRVDGILASS